MYQYAKKTVEQIFEICCFFLLNFWRVFHILNLDLVAGTAAAAELSRPTLHCRRL